MFKKKKYKNKQKNQSIVSERDFIALRWSSWWFPGSGHICCIEEMGAIRNHKAG